MNEPHQHSRSGLLAKPARNTHSENSTEDASKNVSPPRGIANIESVFDRKENTSVDGHFKQTPTSLTGLHVKILSKVRRGLCGSEKESVDEN